MKIGQFITIKVFPILAASISIYSSSTFAQSQTNLPTRMISSEGDKQVLLPDWQRISFNNMPPIQENGSIKANGLSREWNAEDTPDRYLTLGDIDEALKPQLFSLNNITSVSNDSHLNTYNLEDFPLLGEQTIQHLVEVVPNLGQTNTDEVPPIAALLKAESSQTNTNTTLSNLLSQNPTLGKLKRGAN